MVNKRSIADVVRALDSDGCAICRLVENQVRRQIETLERECVMDPDSRTELRATAGFCPRHAEMWARSASVLATAHLYGDLMRRLIDELADLKSPGGKVFARRRSTARPVKLLEPAEPCRLCVESDETAIHFAQVLAQSVNDTSVASRLRVGSLCVPHGRIALEHARGEESFAAIRDHLSEQAAAVHADLREIVRKHDYRFQSEPAGPEVGAGKRAISLISGDNRDRSGQRASERGKE
jgi:hypothetical protein